MQCFGHIIFPGDDVEVNHLACWKLFNIYTAPLHLAQVFSLRLFIRKIDHSQQNNESD